MSGLIWIKMFDTCAIPEKGFLENVHLQTTKKKKKGKRKNFPAYRVNCPYNAIYKIIIYFQDSPVTTVKSTSMIVWVSSVIMAPAWILSPGSGVSVTAAMRDSIAIAKSMNACLILASTAEHALILSATMNADVHGEHQVS